MNKYAQYAKTVNIYAKTLESYKKNNAVINSIIRCYFTNSNFT